MKFTEYGPGDEATWPPCTGHPLDPRTLDTLNHCADCLENVDEELQKLECGDEVCLKCWNAAKTYCSACCEEVPEVTVAKCPHCGEEFKPVK